MKKPNPRRVSRHVFSGVLICCCTAPAWAVDIAGVLPAAMDQPQINLALQAPLEGGGYQPEPMAAQFSINDAPTFNILAFLDTGASGILISANTFELLDPPLGLPFVIPPILLRPDGVTLETVGPDLVEFKDVGVGGSASFNVSTPVRVSLAPFSADTDVDNVDTFPSVYNQSFDDLRLQVNKVGSENGDGTEVVSELDLILANLDVAGMPVLKNKVMVMDARPVDRVIQLFSGATNFDQFLDDLATSGDANINMVTKVVNPTLPDGVTPNPEVPVTNTKVKLSYADFAGYTEVTPGGAGPTLEHNPFIGRNPLAPVGDASDATPGVRLEYDGKAVEGSFLLDTGAAASIISEQIAEQLLVRYRTGAGTPTLELINPADPDGEGFDIPNQFTLTIGGIAGTETVAGFYLDSLLIRAIVEGRTGPISIDDLVAPEDLNFLGAPVLVTNITYDDNGTPDPADDMALDGILGMNFLVGSADFDPTTITFNALSLGAFDFITFDEPNGILGLNLRAAAVPEPTGVAAGVLAASSAVLMRRRRVAAL